MSDEHTEQAKQYAAEHVIILRSQYEAYRAAAKAAIEFRQNAGRHEGPHETADYRPCRHCEESYIEAEGKLDAALAALRAAGIDLEDKT